MSKVHLAVLVFTALLLLCAAGSTAHVSSQNTQEQARQVQAVLEAQTPPQQSSSTARQQPLSRLLLEKRPTILEESKENEGAGGKPTYYAFCAHAHLAILKAFS